MIQETFSKDIVHHNFVAPFLDAVDRNRQLSKNFTLGELYDATFMLPDEWEGQTTIPIHKNAIKVAQLLRDNLNDAIYITSAFRSKKHELKKDRDGSSQHVKALAIDLKGSGLSLLLKEAVEQKNELYHKLRNLGINAFGIYNDFIHLDFRPSKANGSIFYWNELKKKGDSQLKNEDSNNFNYLKYLWIPVLFLIVRKPLLRIFKINRRYKKFTTKYFK